MSNSFVSMDKLHTIAFDFDGVFTDNKVWVTQEGQESVRCDRADGLAFDFLRLLQAEGKCNIDFFILSTETNPVVLARAKKMQIACYHGVKNKLVFMQEYLSKRMPDERDVFSGLAYVGNDLNDLSLMLHAGLKIVPNDGHPILLSFADIVLKKRGGEGCVREFVEHLIGLELMTKEEVHAFISHS